MTDSTQPKTQFVSSGQNENNTRFVFKIDEVHKGAVIQNLNGMKETVSLSPCGPTWLLWVSRDTTDPTKFDAATILEQMRIRGEIIDWYQDALFNRGTDSP